MTRRRVTSTLLAAALLAAGSTWVMSAQTSEPLPMVANPAEWRTAWGTTVPGGIGPAGGPADRAWLSSGTLPVWPRTDGLVAQALLDLRDLTTTDGAVMAGPASIWRYAWPRDSAFVAAAFAATDHLDEARRVLRFLARVQRPDGGFEARYRLDGSGPPDGRTRQSDGAGWFLWALDRVRAVSSSPVLPVDLRAARDRAVGFILAQTTDGTELPPVSPDYWEVPERKVTLGTAAPMAAGLEAAARTYAAEGDTAATIRCWAAAGRLRALIVRHFGPSYQRHGPSGGLDAAVAMLLPPFAPTPSPQVLAAWERYRIDARRPAGGLAPGVEWKADGVSWTPETALVAFTAASSGRLDVAEGGLAWLAAHRTAWGSVPEKVRPDGLPAGPAPLAWTAALVVLTAHALDRSM